MHTLASKRLVTSLHFFIVKKRLLHSFRYLDLWPIAKPSLTSVTAVRNDFLSWWRKAVLETLSDILLWSLRELDSVSPALLTGRGREGGALGPESRLLWVLPLREDFTRLLWAAPASVSRTLHAKWCQTDSWYLMSFQNHLRGCVGSLQVGQGLAESCFHCVLTNRSSSMQWSK